MLAPQLASSWTLSEIGRVRRRDFIKAIAGSAATLPLVARAQQLQMPVIGYLSSRSEQPDAPLVSAFRQGLVESGNVGKSVKIEFRFADNQSDRLEGLAADLIKLKPAAILAGGGAVTAHWAHLSEDLLSEVQNVRKGVISAGP